MIVTKINAHSMDSAILTVTKFGVNEYVFGVVDAFFGVCARIALSVMRQSVHPYGGLIGCEPSGIVIATKQWKELALQTLLFKRPSHLGWPNCLVNLTPKAALFVPSSRCAPCGAAYRGH
jgi:hypothetical protein